MTKSEYMQQLADLCAAAKELGLDHSRDILAIAVFFQFYPEPVRAAIAKECRAVTAKWAKRLRDAIDAQDKQDDLEWFRDYEWPDDLE